MFVTTDLHVGMWDEDVEVRIFEIDGEVCISSDVVDDIKLYVNDGRLTLDYPAIEAGRVQVVLYDVKGGADG